MVLDIYVYFGLAGYALAMGILVMTGPYALAAALWKTPAVQPHLLRLFAGHHRIYDLLGTVGYAAGLLLFMLLSASLPFNNMFFWITDLAWKVDVYLGPLIPTAILIAYGISVGLGMRMTRIARTGGGRKSLGPGPKDPLGFRWLLINLVLFIVTYIALHSLMRSAGLLLPPAPRWF